MDNRADSKQLYREEFEALEEARAYLLQMEPGGFVPLDRYEKLTEDFEKLLRMTAKLSRISDIQGRTLIEREREIRLANDNLKELERLRRDFTSDISHELGTPMTALQGYVKALLDGVVPLDRHYLQTMYDKILIMNQLIEDLFELAKLRGSRMSFQIRELLVEDLVEPLSRFGAQEAGKKGVRLRVIPLRGVPDRGTLILQADLIRIEQVMNNLMANAVKFTPVGGEIQVRFKLEMPPNTDDAGQDRERERAQGTEWDETPDAALVVEVADTGPGMPAEELPLVFDRFYRGSFSKEKDIQGSGLGLAIAKEIIANHRGRIGVESKQGEGSVFYFALPVQWIGE